MDGQDKKNGLNKTTSNHIIVGWFIQGGPLPVISRGA